MTIPLDTTVRGDVLDVLRELPAESVQCCVTSPPYFHARDDGLPPRAWGGFCYTPAVNVPPIHIPAQCCCLGRETSPEAFVGHLVLVFSEVRRVLKSGGLLWLVLGDAYARNGGPRSGPGAHAGNTAHGIQSAVTVCPDGYREKNLIPISWRTALALQADGWLLRTANVWAKPNAMPEPVQDRTVKAHK